MRYFRNNVAASCTLLVWSLAISLILALEATVVFAAPGSCSGSPCGCWEMGCCPGCNAAYPNPPGFGGQGAVYIQVPSCSASVVDECGYGTGNGCNISQGSCYIVPNNVNVAAWSDPNCSQPIQFGADGPLWVYSLVCNNP